MNYQHNQDHSIEIRGLKNAFGDFVVHENLDLDVRRGEILGVVGGSGTGKSVLMRTIIGLNERDAGDIYIFGENFHKLSSKKQKLIEQRIGVLFQDGALFSALTVAQNIKAPLAEHMGITGTLADEIAAFKISMAGLPIEAGDKYPSELSGGMRKRAGLARALALDPEIVFLDEPTAGLDPIGAADFDQLIIDLKDTLGLTVFMVTHDLDSLYTACDRVAVLAEKKIYAIGDIPTISQSDHAWIKEYFGGKRSRMAQSSAVKT